MLRSRSGAASAVNVSDLKAKARELEAHHEGLQERHRAASGTMRYPGLLSRSEPAEAAVVVGPPRRAKKVVKKRAERLVETEFQCKHSVSSQNVSRKRYYIDKISAVLRRPDNRTVHNRTSR